MLRAGASPCRAPAVWCVDIRTWGHYLAVSPAGQSVCLGVPSLISVLCRFSHMPISTCMAAPRTCERARLEETPDSRSEVSRRHVNRFIYQLPQTKSSSPAGRPPVKKKKTEKGNCNNRKVLLQNVRLRRLSHRCRILTCSSSIHQTITKVKSSSH